MGYILSKINGTSIFKGTYFFSEIINNANGMAEVWKVHCEKLYKGDLEQISEEVNTPQEPEILRSEVEHAIKLLRNKKSPGADQITAEVLKALGKEGIEILHQICNLIWKTGQWLEDWEESLFIAIFKKSSPLEYNNYRTVSLIFHASKIFLHIIQNRLNHFFSRTSQRNKQVLSQEKELGNKY